MLNQYWQWRGWKTAEQLIPFLPTAHLVTVLVLRLNGRLSAAQVVELSNMI
jgi:hypothetical protein